MKLKGKWILVTGSSAFVGKNLVEKLKRQGAEVLTLADHDGRRIDIRYQERVKRIINEIRNVPLESLTTMPQFSFILLTHPLLH